MIQWAPFNRRLTKKLARVESGWRNCQDMRCPLGHPNNVSPANPGPPGIVRPRMHRTRPARK